MPDLKQSLLDQDHGHLRIVAEHWGIALQAKDAHSALDELVRKMLDVDLVGEILDTFPEEAILALKSMHVQQGRMLWSQFNRSFGQMREMGPGKRDRERPDLNPISIAETLWYQALVGRAFFNTGRGVEECAYIPTDLHALVVNVFDEIEGISTNGLMKVLGRGASSAEWASTELANDKILDHACTLLAGLRIGMETFDFAPFSRDFIQAIIFQAGILEPGGAPDPENTRAFLEAPRAEALTTLAQTWLNTPEHNDLLYIPGLQIEGDWQNDPIETRKFILRCIAGIPKDTWWSLSAFIADIHHYHPDFQRPAGDYDSWFIKDAKTGEYLRGFDHWLEVDGALVLYLITGPLHWLGITDIASPEEGHPATAFKLSKWADNLLEGIPPGGLTEENIPVHIRSDGRVSVPLHTPRAIRYQLARFCAWEEGNIHEYRYRLTSTSLTEAREAGLRISHLVSLLRHHAVSIPPNILTALEHWDNSGTQVRIQNATILRLGSPQMLTALRNSRAARFLGDPLSPTAIIVKDGAEAKVLAFLVEMGYFGEFIDNSEPS